MIHEGFLDLQLFFYNGLTWTFRSPTKMWAFHKKVILTRKKRMRTTENDASQKITSFYETFDQGGKIQAEQQSLVYLITSSWIYHCKIPPAYLSLIHTHIIGVSYEI